MYLKQIYINPFTAKGGFSHPARTKLEVSKVAQTSLTDWDRILVDTTDFSPVAFFKIFFPLWSIQSDFKQDKQVCWSIFGYTCWLWTILSLSCLEWHISKWEKAFIALEIALRLGLGVGFGFWILGFGFWVTAVPFSSVMSNNRFELLQTFLDLSDIKEQVN